MQDEPRILRPLGYGDLFDETFYLYRRNFILVAGIAAVAYVPSGILFELSPGPGFALYGFVQSLCGIAMTKAVADRYLGKPSSIAAAYGFIFSRFFSCILTLLISGFLVIAGLCLFVVGAIVFSFWTYFVSHVFVVEGRRSEDAIKRSREIASGNWGRIFLVTLLAYLFVFIGVTIVSVAVESFAPDTPPARFLLISGLASGITEALLTPIPAIASILLYFDIRVRKEGFDIQVLADNLAASTAATR